MTGSKFSYRKTADDRNLADYFYRSRNRERSGVGSKVMTGVSVRPIGRGKRGPARTLTPEELSRVLCWIDGNSKAPEADMVKFLMMFHAGMRVCEVANVSIHDVTDASGKISDRIIIRGQHAKNKRAREIPMAPTIRAAIIAFCKRHPRAEYFAVSSRFSTPKRQTPNSLARYVLRIFEAVGLAGCSSHSGRRTFGTTLARAHSEAGHSLRDVQSLLGHARLDTTERYIDTTEDLAGLVNIVSRRFSGVPRRQDRNGERSAS